MSAIPWPGGFALQYAWVGTAACCKHLESEAERVELVIAIGNWSLFAQLLKSLQVPLEEGVQPWPPDGRPGERAP